MNSPHDHHDPDRAELARRLHHQFGPAGTALPEPTGPQRAVARAAQRRRHRRSLAASTAAIALVAGVVTATTRGGDDAEVATAPDGVAVSGDGVPLEWNVAPDGLAYSNKFAASSDGPLYALSTAPGTRYQDRPEGVPRALYRLGDDGQWEQVTSGETPQLGAISERGGVLYALSTGDGAAGNPTGSTSTDGGETWTSIPLAQVEPPSDDVTWYMGRDIDIASTADITVATVVTSFAVPYEEIFPELSVDPHPEDGVGVERMVETSEAGLELVEVTYEEGSDPGIDGSGVEGPNGSTTTAAPGSGPGWAGSEPEVIQTVPWSDLGVSGPDDMAVTASTYVVDGDSWTEVDSPLAWDTRSGAVSLNAAGGHIVANTIRWGPDVDEASHAAFRTADGKTWAEVATPGTGHLTTAGDALVHVGSSDDPDGFQQTVQVSHDAGATWAELDLSSLDERIGSETEHMVSASGGPLGLALTVTFPDEDAAETLLLFSADLARWTVTDLNELSPDSNGFGQPVVGADRIVVPGYGDPRPGDEPGETQTLVATPIRS